jgi:NAD-dependent dihydropyrimidine dehydrogenase PreA subunit
MAQRISVVISQGQSSNPQKRQLEEDIVTGLLFEPGIDVTIIPHLYDLTPAGTGMLALHGITGELVVCSWLYERASHWILDRHKVHGRVGTTLIKPDEEDLDDDDDELDDEPVDKQRVVETRDIPNRNIYCLDLRLRNSAADYIQEIKRIVGETKVQVMGIGDLQRTPTTPTAAQLARMQTPTNDTALALNGNGLQHPAEVPAADPTTSGHAANGHSSNGHSSNGHSSNGHSSNGHSNGHSNNHHSNNGESQHTQGEIPPSDAANGLPVVANVQRFEEDAVRRWYPVIDYSRCTNCMECIDFCLFGVYGVDLIDTILVEQPDNCRKGCPACSRVCPENAIMFPQHKTPAIAGSADAATGLKIDLSLLFGAPEAGKSAAEIAALERDEQLLAVGREAVGMSVGMPKRSQPHDEPRDELDDLVDQLDQLDL